MPNNWTDDLANLLKPEDPANVASAFSGMRGSVPIYAALYSKDASGPDELAFEARNTAQSQAQRDMQHAALQKKQGLAAIPDEALRKAVAARMSEEERYPPALATRRADFAPQPRHEAKPFASGGTAKKTSSTYDPADPWSYLNFLWSNAPKSGASVKSQTPVAFTDPAGTTASLDTFHTVYDPVTGRKFNSPMQAKQYGVTDYVTSLPTTVALPATLKKEVDKLVAQGATVTQALDMVAKPYKMTGEQLRDAETQGALNEADRQAVRSGQASESGGLTPDQLIAKLQAYKAVPPVTAQEFADQQALYADYANRYANSSWNYANMGGKSQDFSLKPADYLGVKATGYADPIDNLLSNMKQNTPSFTRDVDILQKRPEINEAVKYVMATNPDAFKSGNLEGYINNLSSDIDRYGSNTALKNFYKEQQNLVGFGTDTVAGGSHNMQNPAWAAFQQQIMSMTPRADDAAWNTMAQKGVGQNPIDAISRDPTTGLGIGVGQGTVMYYDRDGRPLSSSIPTSEELSKNAAQYGIDLTNIGTPPAAVLPKAQGGLAQSRGYAGGGAVNPDFTQPDMADGGSTIPDREYRRGGSVLQSHTAKE